MHDYPKQGEVFLELSFILTIFSSKHGLKCVEHTENTFKVPDMKEYRKIVFIQLHWRLDIKTNWYSAKVGVTTVAVK